MVSSVSRSILPNFRSADSDHLQGCALPPPLAKWHGIIGGIELERGFGGLDSSPGGNMTYSYEYE